MPTKVFLSRRNLLILLSKLDRKKSGDATACTIIKYADASPPGYKQSIKELHVTAVEDEDYYSTRAPGMMHPADESDKVCDNCLDVQCCGVAGTCMAKHAARSRYEQFLDDAVIVYKLTQLPR